MCITCFTAKYSNLLKIFDILCFNTNNTLYIKWICKYLKCQFNEPILSVFGVIKSCMGKKNFVGSWAGCGEGRGMGIQLALFQPRVRLVVGVVGTAPRPEVAAVAAALFPVAASPVPSGVTPLAAGNRWEKGKKLPQRDQALSFWSGSSDSKTLHYQKTKPREYQIVRTHTKETTWIQDPASPNHQ